MIVSMSELATPEEIERVVERIEELNYKAHVNRQERRTVIGVAGASGEGREAEELRKTPGVESVLRASQPFTLASVEVGRERTVVNVGGVRVGGGREISSRGLAPSSRAGSCLRPRARSSARARRSCAAARTSRAQAPTTFKGSDSKRCGF